MPLSDWSSDVFSPDLSGRDPSHPPLPALEGGDQRAHPFIASISFLTSWLRPRGTMRTSSPLATTIRSSTPTSAIRGPSERTRQLVLSIDRTVPRCALPAPSQERKSAVWGTSGAGGAELGGG